MRTDLSSILIPGAKNIQNFRIKYFFLCAYGDYINTFCKINTIYIFHCQVFLLKYYNWEFLLQMYRLTQGSYHIKTWQCFCLWERFSKKDYCIELGEIQNYIFDKRDRTRLYRSLLYGYTSIQMENLFEAFVKH